MKLKKRILAILYNERPTWLALAQTHLRNLTLDSEVDRLEKINGRAISKADPWQCDSGGIAFDADGNGNSPAQGPVLG